MINSMEKYLSRPSSFDSNPTDEFLSLAGSWKDTRKAEEIITDIKKSRRNSARFGMTGELLDWK